MNLDKPSHSVYGYATSKSFFTQEQDRLLKAALLQGEACLTAWQQWVDSTVLDDVDHASQRLLPLARWNVMRHGESRVREGRVAGIHRYFWCQTTIFMNELRPLLEALEGEGIELVLTGDLALALTLYPDLGCRRVDRCDLLIPENKMSQATETLVSHGCVLRNRPSIRADKAIQWPLHLSTPNGSMLALHPLPEKDQRVGYISTAEHSGRALTRYGLPTRVVDPASLLFDACFRAGEPARGSPIQWIADIALAFQSRSGTLDYEKVCALAQAHALSIRLRHVFTLLRDRYSIPVPEPCLEQVFALPWTRWERIEYRAQTQYGLAGRLLTQYGFHYWRVARGAGGWSAIREYPSFLLFMWNLEHPRRIPAFVLAKLAVSMKQILVGTLWKKRRGALTAGKR